MSRPPRGLSRHSSRRRKRNGVERSRARSGESTELAFRVGSPGELFFDERFERGPGIDALRRLRAGAIELADDPQMLGMLIDAQEDAVVRQFCRLHGCGGCGDFNQILVMSVGLPINPEVDGLVGQRIPVRPRFKLPPVAALANTHAILGR